MSRQGAQDNGLRLEPFSDGNADLVLKWRNASDVRANFLNDAEITRKDHLEFLATLAARNWHFFILHEGGAPQAVLNVNKDGDAALWGCYIGGDSVPRPGLFPLLIGVAGILAFDVLECDTLVSDVLTGNLPPQKINSFLDIPVVDKRVDTRPTGETIDVLCYKVTRADWPSIRARMDKILTRRQRDMLADLAADPQARIY